MKKGRKKKYILCSGLAFQGEEDMKMLQAYALEGWIFREFKGLFYVFHKESAQKLIFGYDLNNVNSEDEADYLQMCELGGWHVIPSHSKSVWFFMAAEETPPLHSACESVQEQYKDLGKVTRKLIFALCGAMLLSFLLMQKITFFLYIFALSSGLLAACAILLIGTQFRQYNRKLSLMRGGFRKGVIGVTVSVIILCIAPIGQHYFVGMRLFLRIMKIIACMLLPASLVMMCWKYPLYRDGKEV